MPYTKPVPRTGASLAPTSHSSCKSCCNPSSTGSACTPSLSSSKSTSTAGFKPHNTWIPPPLIAPTGTIKPCQFDPETPLDRETLIKRHELALYETKQKRQMYHRTIVKLDQETVRWTREIEKLKRLEEFGGRIEVEEIRRRMEMMDA